MAIQIPRGKSDSVIDRMIEVLGAYEADHPRSRIDVYRQNPVSVRVRIIDPDFDGRTKVERSRDVWKYLDSLDDETQADLSALILLTPGETATSLANLEFNDPVASRL